MGTGVWLLLLIVPAVIGLAAYILYNCQKAEMQRYYDAAYIMLKESCLDYAIGNRGESAYTGQKMMIYVKWKNRKKQGYVFDPERGVRIGRNPENNEICIPQIEVSGSHCVIYCSRGRLAVQDLGSSNGTWIRRGVRRHRVVTTRYLNSGDVLMVGNLKIKIKIFLYDMAYM